MGWRYRKRIKILPGIHINISKSGISTNVGVKGASVTFGPKGTYVNAGLPGTGLYRRDKVSIPQKEENTNSFLNYTDSTAEEAGMFNKIALKLIGGVLLFLSIITLISFISYLFTADIDQRIIESLMAGEIHNSKLEFHNICCGWGAYTSWFFMSRCWGYPAFLIPLFFLVVSLRLFGLIRLNLWRCLFSFILIMVWGSVFFAEFINPLLYKNVFNAGGDHGAYIAMVLENNIGIFGLTVILAIVAVVFFYIIHQRTTHINEKDGANITDINYGEDGEKEKDIDYNTNIVAKCTDGTTKEGTGTTSDTVNNRNTINGGFVEESSEEEGKKDFLYPYSPKMDLENYHYPTLDLLKRYDSNGKSYINMEEQAANKNRIVETLRSFGIEISSIKATVGPRITLYEITLAPGVNASKLRGLEDDIALALSSHNVQILIPIPGKGTIGIEVPNIRPSVVPMESILNTKQFQETTMELPCAIGKTITNEVFMFDLTKAPHILIAGSTGQGKSIALNTMIMSLLYKKHPVELKLVLMDPYGVEFGMYAQIAKQFLASLPDEPVIVSNSGQAIGTLNSLCKEMETRYDLLKMANVRNVQEYNNKFANRQLNPAVGHRFMPYIVVVIDEYGDFIEEKGQDFETPIVQLAQYARAVGIHMIISTKRPTNDIITGAIKANFPTRIAFRLPERIDSQVILDCDGAEELLGNGDMLFRAGKSIDCIRVQCAFVDTTEVERVNEFISCQEGYTSSFELPDPYYDEGEYYANDVDMTNLDPLFEDAARLIVMTQEGSTSLIQRKFAIGYNRAGRLMDQLEKAGIVGVAHGSKPLKVLIADETNLESLLSLLRT